MRSAKGRWTSAGPPRLPGDEERLRKPSKRGTGWGKSVKEKQKKPLNECEQNNYSLLFNSLVLKRAGKTFLVVKLSLSFSGSIYFQNVGCPVFF